MFIRFKLLIKNSDSVPKLRIHDVIKMIKGILVSLERLLKIFFKKVTMSKSSPSTSILLTQVGHLCEVLNCFVVI